MQPSLDRLRLVLMRPRNPQNLGGIARAMKNFGLTRWSLVDPRTLDFAAARRVAVHSEELLDRPSVVTTLEEAVMESAWVVGTSSRRPPGVPSLQAREFAAAAVERAQAGDEVALVFGDERSGLTNDELGRCHAVAHLPVAEAQPSLNLAQAVAIFACELRTEAVTRGPRGAGSGLRPAASDAALSQLEAMLGRALTRAGFLHPSAPRHALRDLLRALQRARLSPREWRLWMAAAARLGQRGPGD